MTEPDRAVARVTFTSTQDPSRGLGYARLSWTLTYTMKLGGWQWLIASVAGSPEGVGTLSASPTPAASPTTASDIINWDQAIDFVGDYETVQGPVVSTDFAQDSNDEPTFLNVGLDYPDSGRLSVVIWLENRSNFPQAPEVMYSDKTIRVTGMVTTLRRLRADRGDLTGRHRDRPLKLGVVGLQAKLRLHGFVHA